MSKDNSQMDTALIGNNTVTLPAADYPTRPVIPHPLDTIGAVKNFMLSAGQQVLDRPGQPSAEILKLRLNIVLEEVTELAEAFGLEASFASMMYDRVIGWQAGEVSNSHKYNAVEVLDALTDLRYVTDGTVLACGLQEAFPEAFANVQASNMSKFPATAEELAAAVEKYRREKVDIFADFTNDGFPMVITRASDGKVLKNAAYIPANLAPILEKYSS